MRNQSKFHLFSNWVEAWIRWSMDDALREAEDPSERWWYKYWIQTFSEWKRVKSSFSTDFYNSSSGHHPLYWRSALWLSMILSHFGKLALLTCRDWLISKQSFVLFWPQFCLSQVKFVFPWSLRDSSRIEGSARYVKSSCPRPCNEGNL